MLLKEISTERQRHVANLYAKAMLKYVFNKEETLKNVCRVTDREGNVRDVIRDAFDVLENVGSGDIEVEKFINTCANLSAYSHSRDQATTLLICQSKEIELKHGFMKRARRWAFKSTAVSQIAYGLSNILINLAFAFDKELFDITIKAVKEANEKQKDLVEVAKELVENAKKERESDQENSIDPRLLC